MPLPKAQSLLGTLRRVDGAIQGWGRHYRFCNDETTFAALDAAEERLIRDYLGIYSDERKAADIDGRRSLLGIESLAGMQRDPFFWPAKRKARRTAGIPAVPASLPEPVLPVVIAALQVAPSTEIGGCLTTS